MSKRIIFLVLLVSVGMKVFSQQDEPNVQDCLPYNNLSNENIFFNRSYINPSLSNDSIAFEAKLIAHYQMLGYEGTPKNYIYSIGGKIPKTKNIIGIDFGFETNGRVKSQLLKINYNYNFRLNEKSDVKAGVDLGLSRFKMNISDFEIPGLSSNLSNWNYQPIIDIGMVYRRKNQNIGLSYLGLIRSYINLGYTELTPLTERIIVVNYFSNYRLSNTLNVIPEIIISNSRRERNVFLKGELQYREMFTAGFLYNKSTKYGFMLSVLFFKNVEIGYMFESRKEININNTSGAHTFKLGLIIK